MPVKRRNFCKAKWSHYIALTNKFAKTLLPPHSLDVDAAYQDFYNTIKKAAKKTIPRGYQNNYIPCWDPECESLYKTFLQSPQGDDSSLAGTALLLWHRCLTCKLLRLLPDKHMIKMIMEFFRNQSFTLTTGDSKQRTVGVRRSHPLTMRKASFKTLSMRRV